VAFGALVVFSSVACGVFAEQPVIATPSPVFDYNVIRNHDFENGTEPWSAVASGGGAVMLSADAAFSGEQGLVVSFSGEDEKAGVPASGAIQRVDAGSVPEVISGYYRVERWNAGAATLQIDVVVRMLGAQNPDGDDVHEARFVLALSGSELPPEPGVRQVYLRREAPETGRWRRLSFPVLEAIQEELFWDPTQLDGVVIGMTVRHGSPDASDSPEALVYFDRMYAGPLAFDPNGPIEE
jgi:hypothetical protein